MELDRSVIVPTANTLQYQTSPPTYHLPALQHGHHLQSLPAAPAQANLYGISTNRVAPLQVAQPQVYAAPPKGAVGAGAGAAASSSSGVASWVIVVAVTLVVLVICGGIAAVIVVVTQNGSSESDNGGGSATTTTTTPITENPCSSNEFHCVGGSIYGDCIQSSWVCDNINDCSNAADEANCGATSATEPPSTSCAFGQFQCVASSIYGNCITSSWHCDGENDCFGGSDEVNCPSTTDPNKFTCPGSSTEIEKTKVCDGSEDCPGGGDEDRCVIALDGSQSGEVKVYSSASGEHHYICAEGWTDLKSESICEILGFGCTGASTTEAYSAATGLVSSGTFSLNGLNQQEPVTCTDNKIVKITWTNTAVCGTTSKSGRIVGGSDADILDYPWQVSLQGLQGILGWNHFCGGTIVFPNWVVTAAHCIDSFTSDQYHLLRVVAGETSIATSPAVSYSLDNIIGHPLYNDDTKNMDIALIHVTSSFAYSDAIQPACLPSSGQVFDDDSVVIATGWGTTSEGGELAETLQVVEVNLQNTATCRNTIYGNAILDGMICAGVDAGGKDSCQGDSGGPLIISHNAFTLIGATSFGSGCARPGIPGVYAEISYAIDWIKREMAKGRTVQSKNCRQ